MDLQTKHFVFCNGLVVKPMQWNEHLLRFKQELSESVGEDFCVQLNVDWRPYDLPLTQMFGEATQLFGPRLRSIVTYWDPAHNLADIQTACSCLEKQDSSAYLRIVLKSSESIRMLGVLSEQIALSNRRRVALLLSIDALSTHQVEALQSLLPKMALKCRYQITHETPAGLLEIVDARLIAAFQIAIGSERNISADGSVVLDDGMVVKGEYNVLDYLEQCSRLAPDAFYVVMGPTLPQWTQDENRLRLKSVCSLLSQLPTPIQHGCGVRE